MNIGWGGRSGPDNALYVGSVFWLPLDRLARRRVRVVYRMMRESGCSRWVAREAVHRLLAIGA